MEEILWFTIRGTLPGLNEVRHEDRLNKYAGARMKEQTDSRIVTEIRLAERQKTIRPVDEQVEICIEWHEPNRKRDVDNVQSAKKFVLDALVKAKILPNDTRKWVRQVHDIVVDEEEKDKWPSGRVVVYLTTMEGRFNYGAAQ